jgi:plastocyanin domain-containing protein
MSFIRFVITPTLCLAVLLTAVAAGRKGDRNHRQTATKRRVQTVRVRITKRGYEPKSLSLKPDVPARITFVRETNESCGTEIVLKDYGISKPLPLGKPVTVEFTPTGSGEFKFTCGMDMLRGKIIVQ